MSRGLERRPRLYAHHHQHALCFFCAADEGLNYSAILETAADIAKAMLHLHSTQVRRRGAGQEMYTGAVHGISQGPGSGGAGGLARRCTQGLYTGCHKDQAREAQKGWPGAYSGIRWSQGGAQGGAQGVHRGVKRCMLHFFFTMRCGLRETLRGHGF